MINLKLKAEFETQSNPFVVKLFKKGLYPGNDLDEKQIAFYEQDISYLKVEFQNQIFKIYLKEQDDFHGDVILCIPEASRVQRLIRSNSKNNTILFTERCDQMCAMCSQPPKSSIDKWRFPHYQKAIELSNRDSVIGISGGEPTLYKKELFKILLNSIEKRPDVKFHILSNGQHFEDSDIETLKKLNEGAEILWGIPLYSADKALHDEIVGKKGAFDLLMQNLFLIASAGTSIELRTVLMKKNALELTELSKFISKNLPFISKWAIMALEPIGFAKANYKELFFDHSVAKFPIQNSLDIAEANFIRAQLYNFPLCTLDKKYRDKCAKSISDWKNKYIDNCFKCDFKDDCCGFFEWYNEKWSWEKISPIKL